MHHMQLNATAMQNLIKACLYEPYTQSKKAHGQPLSNVILNLRHRNNNNCIVSSRSESKFRVIYLVSRFSVNLIYLNKNRV